MQEFTTAEVVFECISHNYTVNETSSIHTINNQTFKVAKSLCRVSAVFVETDVANIYHADWVVSSASLIIWNH